MKTFGVIMAGGGGTRFWPLSRQEMPKQLLNLSGKERMINETIDRIKTVVPQEDIFIVTNISQEKQMEEAVKGRIKKANILSEPSARNTAACIGYAAMEIIRKHGDGIMCIFPADHYIKNQNVFSEVLRQAIKEASAADKLVTIGIAPTFPATGYGYIRYQDESDGVAKPVMEFVEKPDYDTACRYLTEGCYAWNSGIFIWKATVILKEFKRLLPDIYACLEEIGEAINTPEEAAVINRVYPTIPKISIDYGIMERADQVIVIPGDFGWNDVGSWDTLGVLYEKDLRNNVLHGDIVPIDTKDSICYSSGRLIATIGVENLIVVETPDAVLICDKDRAQDVKQVVDMLKEQGRKTYL